MIATFPSNPRSAMARTVTRAVAADRNEDYVEDDGSGVAGRVPTVARGVEADDCVDVEPKGLVDVTIPGDVRVDVESSCVIAAAIPATRTTSAATKPSSGGADVSLMRARGPPPRASVW